MQFKNQNTLNEIEEKKKSIENLKQLVDTLNKQNVSVEDNIKKVKAQNKKNEDKLNEAVNQINLGNEAVKKLENEIKNQKLKVINKQF